MRRYGWMVNGDLVLAIHKGRIVEKQREEESDREEAKLYHMRPVL